jgi:hypothetical protein
MALEGGYTIDSVIHPDRGGNEYASSSWYDPMLTWTYCIPQGACITNETISLNGDSLETNWWDDQGGAGSTKMQRVSSPPPLGREAVPGMAGRWLDPDSTGTYHLIVWENGKYIVAATLNPETGENEVTTSTWADGVLTWTYCVSGGPCVTTETVSYSYGSLKTNWSNDQGYSGSTTMERMP